MPCIFTYAPAGFALASGSRLAPAEATGILPWPLPQAELGVAFVWSNRSSAPHEFLLASFSQAEAGAQIQWMDDAEVVLAIDDLFTLPPGMYLVFRPKVEGEVTKFQIVGAVTLGVFTAG